MIRRFKKATRLYGRVGKFIFSTGNISWNFWAWKEVFYGHQELLKENFKNILLRLPIPKMGFVP